MMSLKLIVVVILVVAQCMHGGNSSEPPEIYRRTCEFVKHYGYPCESHVVKTEDGFLLTMHRIPHGKNNGRRTEDPRPVVFLQHGLMDSSATWVINEPDKSLGFLLADRGYDVWMGNNRGNTYSDKHVSLKTYQSAFWDYSFHEMGEFDLPAQVGFVLEQSGADDLSYIGHSQGTTQAFTGFSRNKALASRINMFIAFAPIAYMHNTKGLLRFLSTHLLNNILDQFILKMIGSKQFSPSSWIMKYIATHVCGKLVSDKICASVMFLTAGTNTGNIDMQRVPVYMSHNPAGTSVKSMLHFAQLIKSGKFRMYDYGWNGNIQHYKQPTPPPYHVGEMRVPFAMFTGESDWLSTVPDVVEHLRHNVPNLVYSHQVDNWNHLDFMLAANAKEVIYDKVFKLLAGEIPKQ